MRHFTTLAALATLALLPACTSEAASPAGTYSVELVTDGLPAEQKQMMDNMMNMGDCILHADGTWESSMEVTMPGMDPMKSTVKGTWKLDGDSIEMVDTESDGKKSENPKAAKGTYMNGVITIEVPGDGQMPPMTMRMTKKQ